MLLFSTAVFMVPQWIFLGQWAHDRDPQYTAAVHGQLSQGYSSLTQLD